MTYFAVRAILGGEHRAALAIVLIAGLTDGLDGWLARRFGWESTAGAYLDPVADKVLLSSLYLALGAAGRLPWWLVWLVLGRDLAILLMVLAALLVTRLRSFPPTVWGKLSTFAQIAAALAAIGAAAFDSALLTAASAWLVWAAGAATAWSGAHYFWRGFEYLGGQSRASL